MCDWVCLSFDTAGSFANQFDHFFQHSFPSQKKSQKIINWFLESYFSLAEQKKSFFSPKVKNKIIRYSSFDEICRDFVQLKNNNRREIWNLWKVYYFIFNPWNQDIAQICKRNSIPHFLLNICPFYLSSRPNNIILTEQPKTRSIFTSEKEIAVLGVLCISWERRRFSKMKRNKGFLCTSFIQMK